MSWLRQVKKSDLEGKTIKEIDCRSVNTLTLHFTDGSKVELEVEHIGYGLYGIMTMPTAQELVNGPTEE